MTPKSKLFGVGARYGVVFVLDETTGLPENNGTSATLDSGYEVEGIKTFTPNDPEPQVFTHYGNDRPQAQDALPPTEAMRATLTTDKSNQTLDSVLAGTEIRDYTVVKYIPVNTNKDGSEKQVAFFAYRQALAGDPSDPVTFGKQRVWESRIIPSCRIVSIENAFEQGATDKTYNLIPTPVKQTPWKEALTEDNWGATELQMLDGVHDYQPRWGYGYGNGTLAGFVAPAVPVDNSHFLVWVDGTLVTPATLTNLATTGEFTFSSGQIPGVDKLIFVEVQTTEV